MAGRSEALWSIKLEVHKHRRAGREGTYTVTVVEWAEGSRVVQLGACLETMEEKTWVVGEVLAWLRQVGLPVWLRGWVAREVLAWLQLVGPSGWGRWVDSIV
jgi:Ser/Thr protein kinase RdoA (MazF antagonist)